MPKEFLWSFIPEPMHRIAIVGLAKNVGKTTVLNELMEEGALQRLKIGIASIGVDGEAVDVWDHHTKPAIYLQEGMWAATAKAALAESSASFRYVEELKSSSPLGPVYLVQCTKSGTVKLAGTHLLADLEKVQEAFQRHQVTHTFIDGAYDRIAAAQSKIADGFILCTGAALDPDIQWAAAKTEEVITRWKLPVWEGAFPETGETVAFLNEGKWALASSRHALQIFDQIRLIIAEGIEALWMPGALTESMLQKCLGAQAPFTIIIDNPTKCFVQQSTLLRWFRKGGAIYVKQKSKLLALAVNPFSPQKLYSSREWLHEMKRIAGDVPVLDVRSKVVV